MPLALISIGSFHGRLDSDGGRVPLPGKTPREESIPSLVQSEVLEPLLAVGLNFVDGLTAHDTDMRQLLLDHAFDRGRNSWVSAKDVLQPRVDLVLQFGPLVAHVPVAWSRLYVDRRLNGGFWRGRIRNIPYEKVARCLLPGRKDRLWALEIAHGPRKILLALSIRIFGVYTSHDGVELTTLSGRENGLTLDLVL